MWGIQSKFAENKIISPDGTPISFFSSGQGPGLLIVHGALGTSRHYLRLAMALSDTFTVHVMDRRGRGKSGPQGEAYDMDKECEDAAAILQATGTSFLFGHSYGGLVVLETALVYPVRKIALYEPGLSVHQSIPHGWLKEFRQALDRRDYPEALLLFIHGLRLLSPFDKIPKPLLRLFLRWAMTGGERNETVQLLHSLESEIREVARLDSMEDKYRGVSARTLVMIGSDSPAYMMYAASSAAKSVPNATLTELTGLDHMAPVAKDVRELSRHLKNFYIDEDSVKSCDNK
ncbi:alpha/beta hydrolase [Cohnella pontilimi]|uniref:Alpha/beta hydrolase n=1 Tax=Cohnella pontilimi TaxID=2564100 RepID=A0A4U0F346_9BACL|nr:alpha/beta hydrolase [Cohnella pontilimi]TJY38956.1 alpha/beta hydrolase [Cohnella pontilimi]